MTYLALDTQGTSTTHTPNDQPSRGKISLSAHCPSLCTIAAAGIIGLVSAFSGTPTEPQACEEQIIYSKYGFTSLNPDCLAASWLNATQANADQLTQLEHDQLTIGGETLFYYSDDPALAPLHIPLKGALKDASVIKLFNENERTAKFAIKYDELCDYPSLKKLVSDYEKSLPQWHDGEKVIISEIYFEQKRAATQYQSESSSFHLDSQGDDKYLSISTVSPNELPPSQMHKEWLTHSGSRVVLSADQSTTPKASVQVFNLDTEQNETLAISDLSTPICIPDAQTQVVTGLFLKDIKHDGYRSPTVYNTEWSSQEILKKTSIYSSGATILTGRHVHNGPEAMDVSAVQIDMDATIEDRAKICGLNKRKRHSRILLGVNYKLVNPVQDAIEIDSVRPDFNW